MFPTMTVLENVMVAFPQQPGDQPWQLFGRGWRDVEAANRTAALELLERLGLAADAQKRAGKTSRSGAKSCWGSRARRPPVPTR